MHSTAEVSVSRRKVDPLDGASDSDEEQDADDIEHEGLEELARHDEEGAAAGTDEQFEGNLLPKKASKQKAKKTASKQQKEQGDHGQPMGMAGDEDIVQDYALSDDSDGD